MKLMQLHCHVVNLVQVKGQFLLEFFERKLTAAEVIESAAK